MSGQDTGTRGRVIPHAGWQECWSTDRDGQTEAGLCIRQHQLAPSPVPGASDAPSLTLSTAPLADHGFAAREFLAISGTDPQPIHGPDGLRGYWCDDAGARHAWITGILPDDPSAARDTQTSTVLERAAALLELAGLGWGDVIRTWFFNDRILEWYDTFNQVRTAFFKQHGILRRLVPVSTGIGAPNSVGAALVLSLYAVRPTENTPLSLQGVDSPLQGSALDYGSSFSRALEIGLPSARSLLVSGTASIDREGATLHPTDGEAQVKTTMDVVERILTSRDMQWADTTRAVAYIADPSVIDPFVAAARSRGLPAERCVMCAADICRDDLMFEIEIDAATGPAASRGV